MKTTLVAVRLDEALVNRLKLIITQNTSVTGPGLRVAPTFSDVVRRALVVGLEHIEKGGA